MQLFKMMHAAFPNMKWDAQEILVDGDKAVARVRFTGTNDGEFMGMPATGRSVSVEAIDIVRFDADGRAVRDFRYSRSAACRSSASARVSGSRPYGGVGR